MKKIPEYTSDDNMFFYMNALVDLINSQQEAIEKLKEDTWIEFEKVRHALQDHYSDPEAHQPADDKPEKVTLHDIVTNTPEGSAAVDRALERSAEQQNEMKRKAEEIRDTHRIVTLRIPKGMRIGEAIWKLQTTSDTFSISDTDLQKALDEVQPNE
jgi:hypothetical protein